MIPAATAPRLIALRPALLNAGEGVGVVTAVPEGATTGTVAMVVTVAAGEVCMVVEAVDITGMGIRVVKVAAAVVSLSEEEVALISEVWWTVVTGTAVADEVCSEQVVEVTSSVTMAVDSAEEWVGARVASVSEEEVVVLSWTICEAAGVDSEAEESTGLEIPNWVDH